MDEQTRVLVDLEALKTRREGMIAENMQRQSLGHSIAYTDNDFYCVENEIQSLHTRYA